MDSKGSLLAAPSNFVCARRMRLQIWIWLSKTADSSEGDGGRCNASAHSTPPMRYQGSEVQQEYLAIIAEPIHHPVLDRARPNQLIQHLPHRGVLKP